MSQTVPLSLWLLLAVGVATVAACHDQVEHPPVQVFKYTGDDGRVGFADSLDGVPEKHRARAVATWVGGNNPNSELAKGLHEDRKRKPAQVEPTTDRNPCCPDPDASTVVRWWQTHSELFFIAAAALLLIVSIPVVTKRTSANYGRVVTTALGALGVAAILILLVKSRAAPPPGCGADAIPPDLAPATAQEAKTGAPTIIKPITPESVKRDMDDITQTRDGQMKDIEQKTDGVAPAKSEL